MESVDVEEGIIKFENYSKQLPVPFKIYANFDCNLQDTEIYEGSCTKKYHVHKDIFACLFSIHNTISLSCHEQVCLSGLRFERYLLLYYEY